jgi:dephospho-CoA kinase
VRFEVSENITKERKIELFDYYLEKDTNELIKLITDMIEEFAAESESSEYGGG